MNKIIVTACVAVLAAAAAQAQSWGTAGDINLFGQQYLESKKVQQKVDSVAKNVERQILLAKVAQYKQAVAQKAAAGEEDRQKEQRVAAKASDSCPSYYCGREGKVIVLGELILDKIADKKAEKAEDVRQGEVEKATEPQDKKASLFKAVFLGGRYPWETEEDYRVRQSVRGLPATQPFK